VAAALTNDEELANIEEAVSPGCAMCIELLSELTKTVTAFEGFCNEKTGAEKIMCGAFASYIRYSLGCGDTASKWYKKYYIVSFNSDLQKTWGLAVNSFLTEHLGEKESGVYTKKDMRKDYAEAMCRWTGVACAREVIGNYETAMSQATSSVMAGLKGKNGFLKGRDARAKAKAAIPAVAAGGGVQATKKR